MPVEHRASAHPAAARDPGAGDRIPARGARAPRPADDGILRIDRVAALSHGHHADALDQLRARPRTVRGCHSDSIELAGKGAAMQALERRIVAIDQEEALAVAAFSEPHTISAHQLLAKLDHLLQRHFCARITGTVGLVRLAQSLAEGDALGY